MKKQWVLGLLVIGAGCAGVDDSGTPTPGAAQDNGPGNGDDTPGTDGSDPTGAVTPAATPGGTWTKLTNVPSQFTSAGFQLLLTDGSVMVSEVSTGRWWRLRPSITGSYLNGTWSQLATMPSGYTPLYFGA